MGCDVYRPVLCIVGPTGTGKSELGVEIAKAVGGAVLSADSMQVYRGMDIGTAKLTVSDMQGVPHYLLDLVAPDVRFTAADWKSHAEQVIDELHRAGKLPIVVGGTGLYIRALTEDLDFSSTEGSPEIRDKWRQFEAEEGRDRLYEALLNRDPASAARLHPNDTRRVIRALEVSELRQLPLSKTYDWRIRGGRYNCTQFGLTMSREDLYTRVNERVDRMMQLGLLDEVQKLVAAGYSAQLSSMQAIGYKELCRYIAGESTLDRAVEDIKQATRRFVKRQLSWFRRDDRVQWVERNPLLPCVESPWFYSVLKSAREMLAGIHVQGRE